MRWRRGFIRILALRLPSKEGAVLFPSGILDTKPGHGHPPFYRYPLSRWVDGPSNKREKPPFATRLLPFLIAPPLERGTQRDVDATSGVILHPRHHVRVQVHGDRNVRVAEPFLHDLGMDVGLQQMGRV